MKTVFGALAGALGTTLACWRLLLLLWALNAIVAWVLVVPLNEAVGRTWEHNPLAVTLLAAFDNESWVDFTNVEASALDATLQATRNGALPWILVWTMLSAGLMAHMLQRRRFGGLLASIARYGHRFAWVLLLTLLAFWGVAGLNDLLGRGVTAWLVGDSFDSGAGVLGWTMTLKTLFMLAVVGLVTTTSLFARVRIIQLDERFVPLTWLRSLVGVVRHLPSLGLARVLSLWLLVAVLWLYQVVQSEALTGGLLTDLRMPWRLFVVFQVFQLLIQTALVYRFAVGARLWPVLAPGDARPVRGDAPTRPPADEPRAAVREAPADPPDEQDERGRIPRPLAGLLLVFAAAAFSQDGQDGAPPPVPAPAPAPTTAAHPTAATGRAETRNAYVMEATVDLEQHVVSARERATFFNTTSASVGELWLHLYPSAFSNTHTLWIAADDPKDILRRGPTEAGSLDVRSVRLEGGADLAAQTSIQETLMRVTLPEPVPPGGDVTLAIEFETRFPRVVARMGKTGHHLDGMQWYPKFCAHDETGWHADPYYRTGEFFADFGSYDVTFRYHTEVDGDAVEFEATGVPGEARSDGDGWTTRRFEAHDVHDFAFCADPAFRRFERDYRDPLTGHAVQIVYLCQPYAVPKAEQVLDLLESCLRHSAEWWMPYPYPRLVVDGLPHSLRGGMEYPMLFTISQRFPNHWDWLVDLTEDPAGVTAHEFGHQYWYGIIASNEVEEAWLDEGFNTWATTKLLEAHWPDAGVTDALTFLERTLLVEALNGALRGTLPGLGDVLSLQQLVGWRSSPFHDTPPEPPGSSPKLLGYDIPSVWDLRLPDMSANRTAWEKRRYYDDARTRPLSAPSRDFTEGYGIVYRKTALILKTLENHVGADAMAAIMRTYVERFAFRHPTGDDFLAVVSELTGGVHDALLRQLIETDGVVDYAVEEVSSRKIEALTGYAPQTRPGDALTWAGPEALPDPEPERPWTRRVWGQVFSTPFPGELSTAADTADDVDGEESGSAEAVSWRTRYVVRQLGQIEAPVEIEVRFEDGSSIREPWDGRGGYHHFEHVTDARMTEVMVDPDRRFAIDIDVNNNGYLRRSATETTWSLSAFFHFWTQNALSGWSMSF